MAQKAKRGLGRGFEALISQDFDQSLLLTAEDRVESIPVDRLEPNPHQPRTHFDQAALNELSQSIKQYGVVQPLVVTPVKDGKYTLVAGERRWRASKLAGLKTVPAIIRGRQELETLEIALIENVQRVDLSPLEQAVSIERLHEQFNLSYDQIAKRLGKASSTVNNTVRLLQLPANARTGRPNVSFSASKPAPKSPPPITSASKPKPRPPNSSAKNSAPLLISAAPPAAANSKSASKTTPNSTACSIYSAKKTIRGSCRPCGALSP
jgi:ParB/RepB/Spo0J family partition protein